MNRIPSNIIVFCLAFSVFESYAAAISHVQTHLSISVRGFIHQNDDYSAQIQSNNAVQNIKTEVNPLKYTPMKTDTIKKDVFHYIHDTSISTAAKIMKGSSEFVGLRFGIEKLVESGAYPKIAYLPPPFIYSKNEVNTLIFQKRKVWTIKPKSAKKQVILYLHGGGYVANLSLVHWDFIQEIVQKTNSIIVVPDYPLSPDFTYRELFNYMDELYSWISQAYPECEIVFMGDSAGGGLSLAYAQLIQIRNQELEDRIKKNRAQSFHFNNSLLSDGAYSDSSGESVANLNTTDNFKVRMNKDHSVESVNNLNTPINLNIDSSIEKNIPTLANTIDLQSTVGHWKAPKKVILLSPWLDLGMKNPEAKPIAELDKILSYEVLKLCAQAYLGHKKPSEELLQMQQVSPINGPILSNTEIALFTGTHDLFFADSQKLKHQYSDVARFVNSEFSGFQFYEYPQMFHVWMLFTKLPESQTVIGQITEFLGAN